MASDALAVERAIAAIQAGQPVLLPADGVYGLCATAFDAAATQGLYELKGRGAGQPTAVIAASLGSLFAAIPELDERSRTIAAAVLPGAYTLVLPNPAERFAWLNGTRLDTIGVRVADVPPATQLVLDAVELVVATSANDPGEPSAATLDAVPPRIRAGCGAELDAGLLSGQASTVLDCSGDEPAVLRAGAGDVAAALERIAAAVGP